MKITIEGKRGEGVTTLATLLYNFLLALPYNIEIDTTEDRVDQSIMEKTKVTNEMLYETKDIEIITKKS